MTSIDTRPLCTKLAGSIHAEDFARFDETFQDRDAAYWIERSPDVRASLEALLKEGMSSAEQVKAAALESISGPGFDVVQIWPDGYGYRVKVSAAPTGMNPTETQMSAPQAQQAFPQQALDTADQQGAATLTNVEAEPDPLIESPVPAQTFGVYKVFEEGTGKQYVGFVIPGLMDPATGGPSASQLFTNGSVYCLQDTPFQGILVSPSTNLPESQIIRGLGVFYRANEKNLMVTVPYEVIGEVTLEGNTSYAARDQMGQEVQIVFSPGLKRPVLSPPNTIALPDDCRFLMLDHPIQLSAPGADPMAAAKQASADTRLRIEAWDTGTCRLSGPVVNKVASGSHSWKDGMFWMAACGIKQAQATELLEFAASTGRPIDLYNLPPLSSIEETKKEAAAAAAAIVRVRAELPKQASLLLEAARIEEMFRHDEIAEALGLDKQAAKAVGAQTVDAVLGLNFLNPENIDTFVEGIPQLEEASSKLAQLSFASTLGLDAVDSNAVTRAMDSLEAVIEGLKSLRRLEV